MQQCLYIPMDNVQIQFNECHLCQPFGCRFTCCNRQKKEVINELGAVCKEIKFSKLRYNVNRFEGCLQHEIGSLPLGHRLHRAESTGQFNDPDEGHDCYLTRTYITYFKRIVLMVSLSLWRSMRKKGQTYDEL